MTLENLKQANEEPRIAWNRNAAFWNEWMGEGNDFVEVLIWPATERLLDLRPGERVLDIACRNGLTARRLAAMGAEVVAFDFAEEMIPHARERTIQRRERIHYVVLDATDEAALLALGKTNSMRLSAIWPGLCWMVLKSGLFPWITPRGRTRWGVEPTSAKFPQFLLVGCGCGVRLWIKNKFFRGGKVFL